MLAWRQFLNKPRKAVQLGDGIAGLWSLEAGSVGLVLSDLPSGETQAVFDTKADLPTLWPAVWHALRPNGIAVFMASSLAFAAELRASQLDAYRYDRIWRKSLPTGHLNAKKRPLRIHEFILVFWRNEGAYNPQMTTGHAPISSARQIGHGANYGSNTRLGVSRRGATDRYPVSVLDFAGVNNGAKSRVHPQQKPVDLLTDLIATYSLPGDLVADPYAGSGSTGEAAKLCSRRCVMWDCNPRFGG